MGAVMVRKFFLAGLCLIFIITFHANTCLGKDYTIGVYYFPAWGKGSRFWNELTARPGTRTPGKVWSEREPLSGFDYDGNSPEIMQQHIQWAADHGLDFIAFEWWWLDEGKPRTVPFRDVPSTEAAIQNFLKAPNRNRLKFCLFWANIWMPIPCTREVFRKAVAYWLDNFFSNPQYLTIDGQPVVFIFVPSKLEQGARASRTTVRAYFAEAREMAVKRGLKGIYFVACANAIEHLVTRHIPQEGYSAISAFHYGRGFSGRFERGGFPTTYEELLAGYRQSWNWILKNSPLPYLVPMSAGLDKRPAGGTTVATSTPESFETMLRAGKEVMDRYPEKTKRTGVICAWNEFTEGAYIEPTKKWKFQYLEKIKLVFGK